jgi:antitoxin ParD1/3/4
MSQIEKLSIALTTEMVAELREAVEQGDYGSVSEVVRDALRDWRRRRQAEALERQELIRMLREGIESDPGVDAEPVFARLRARYAGEG